MDNTADAIHRNRHAVAGAVGAVAFLLLWLAADWGFFWGLVGGLVVYGLALLVITLIGRSDGVRRQDMTVPERRSGLAASGGAAAAGGGAAAATSPAVTGTPVGEGVAAEPGPTPAAGASVLGEAHGHPPMDAATAATAATDAERSDRAEMPADVPLASDPAEAPAVPVSKSRPEAVAEAGPESTGMRPPTLDTPRTGGADDLQQIRGVGPKLEELCNRLGFWHYDQIANWSEAEVDWVDQHLEGFRGRVRRDDWVAQARALVEGRNERETPGAPAV